MVPLHIHIVVKGFWQHAYWDITLWIHANNNAQELTPYRFGFKCDTNRKR
jgi:hypothetical protein